MTMTRESKPYWRALFAFCALVVLGVVLSAVVAVSDRKTQKTCAYDDILGQLSHSHPRLEWENGELVEVYFDDAFANFQLQDSDLALLAKLPALRLLSIEFAPNLSDSAMMQISKLENLEVLWIKFTPITNAGLVSLNRADKVTSLRLYDTCVTDDGLSHLADIPELRSLDLRFSEVTDAGLMALAAIPSLCDVSLVVDDSKVTQEGVELFRRKWPQIQLLAASPAHGPRSPSAEPRIVGDYPRTRQNGFMPPILLAEVVEGATVVQLVCLLRPQQLAETGFTCEDIEERASLLYNALEAKLPPKVAQWFSERCTREKPAPSPSHEQLEPILRSGLILELRVGCRGGDSLREATIVN